MTADPVPLDMEGVGETLDWRSLLPVFVVVSIYAAGMAAVLPVLPFHVREAGGSPLALGVVIATEAFCQFASAPFLGQLSDRFGRKRILLASQLIGAISLVLLASAGSVAFIVLARAIFGLTAGNLSAAMAYVADRSSAASRRQAIGILTGSVGLGGIVGAGISGLLSDTSLTTPIYTALALTLVAAAVTFLVMDDRRTARLAEAAVEGEKVSLRAILDSAAVRILIVVMLCHFFAYGLYVSQMPVFLAETFVWNGHAFTAKELSYLIMADGAINILVQLFLLGWLGAFMTERNLILLIFLLACSGFVIAANAGTIPVLALAVLCISTGDALAKPTYLAALSVHVSSARQGIVIGGAQSLVAAADVVSPVFGGLILSHALYDAWIGAAVAIALAGAVIALARLS
ncbi:MFS transporter [Paracoccus luteus]|uniref:MFS transporter n=1 Tax=Paracoccus luteus TaxID=2508543 RepID=UPI00106F743C|nr:MFS transporter [Paracoccus luteus]